MNGAPVILADQYGVAALTGDGQRLGLLVDLIDQAIQNRCPLEDSCALSSRPIYDCLMTVLGDVSSTVAARWTCVRDTAVPDDLRRLLAGVPEWFGLPDATIEYVDAARTKETWTVRGSTGAVLGVTLVDRHFPHVAEIYLTVVEREFHGCGIGSAMIQAIEADARCRGVRLLEVKTLGPSHSDPGYVRTRHFYESHGFLPLEETDLWGEQNPCLFMIKPLAPSDHPSQT